jgi:hypothetical protein
MTPVLILSSAICVTMFALGFVVTPDNQRIQRVCGLSRGRGRKGGSRFASRLAAQQPVPKRPHRTDENSSTFKFQTETLPADGSGKRRLNRLGRGRLHRRGIWPKRGLPNSRQRRGDRPARGGLVVAMPETRPTPGKLDQLLLGMVHERDSHPDAGATHVN